MPEFKDSGHRPHADHRGEEPTTGIDRGPHGLKVTLDDWGPWNPRVMAAYLQSNWGEHPERREAIHPQDTFSLDRIISGDDVPPIVKNCLEGRTLQQILEGISFWFTIDGVCRPATHQIVRTRDAAFMQHGGRDNDWRHRRFSMPETIERAILAEADQLGSTGLKHCITDWAVIDHYREEHASDRDLTKNQENLFTVINEYLEDGKKLYSALVDAGIPWQDARRLLPMGLQTYIHAVYPFRTLQHTLANRLEHIMDWEYNCVGQLMVRELHIHCPSEVAACFKSASDKLRRAAMAGLESWPPDGKWPDPKAVCKHCHLTVESHAVANGGACLGGATRYTPVDGVTRTHRPEQNPFWILTDAALRGGPVEWIATDGVYPHDNPKAPKAK